MLSDADKELAEKLQATIDLAKLTEYSADVLNRFQFQPLYRSHGKLLAEVERLEGVIENLNALAGKPDVGWTPTKTVADHGPDDDGEGYNDRSTP